MPNTYFLSDSHYSHANIIKYCPDTRPFKNVEEMNHHMISEWNSVVNDDDTVYFLGDFMFGKGSGWIFYQLKGLKHLIRGNHDYEETRELHWESQHSILDLKPINKMNVILCHYPLESWDRMGRGSIHLHGHIHSTPTDRKILSIKNRFDVGVDRIGFQPRTLIDIINV